MGRVIDLTGQRFNYLTVIKQVKPKKNYKSSYAWWLCKCDCGNYCEVSSHNLRNQGRLSCGCMEGQKSKRNSFEFLEDCIKVYDINNRPFLIDYEDWEFIKDKYCFVIKTGYVKLTYNGKQRFLHEILMNKPNDMCVDHINRNPSDNRRSNLRICTKRQNNINREKQAHNSSGYVGVCFNKQSNKWVARIMLNNKSKQLGSFSTKEEALIARLKGEKEYFGEFAPQQYLFKQYGIE